MAHAPCAAYLSVLLTSTTGWERRPTPRTQAAADAVDKTKKLADGAVDASVKAVDSAAGQLSEQSQTWLVQAAKDSEQTIEDVIASGEQHAPAALRIARALASAVERESSFEPISVKVSDQADADAKLGEHLRWRQGV